MTIRDALGMGAKDLKRVGGAWGSGALDAEVLLAHALGVAREALYLRHGDRVPPAALRRYRAAIARRKRHEPVAFIVGEKEFFGLPLFVKRGACLIPRPETEILVERAIASLQAPSSMLQAPVFDVGTGSGAIAVAVAKHVPAARIVATDTDPRALAIARRNAKRHGVADRIFFKKADLLPSPPSPSSKFEVPILILANLPYVPTAEWRRLPPEIRRYEPRAALDGGRDGLAPYRRLLDALAERGTHNAECMTLPTSERYAIRATRYAPAAFTMLAEIHPEQAERFARLVRARWPSAAISFRKDLSGRIRVVETTVR